MKRAFIAIGFFLPSLALAATDKFENFKQLVYFVISLFDLAIPVAAGIALLVFFWGLAKFISNSGDPKGNEAGKNLMIWGVVALFVMISFKGLIAIAQSQFGISESINFLPYIPLKQN